MTILMRWCSSWPAALVVALAAACQPAAGPLTAEDVAAINDLRDRWAAAARANDVAAALALYTEDAVEMPPTARQLEGRAGIQARLEQAFSAVAALTLQSVETAGRDGLAYDRGPYSLTVRVEGQPQPVTETGKFIAILTKQPDGTWRIHRLIWNSDAPPATGSAPPS
jgi:uncharacterized protein (TIGR02246 family)